MGSMRRVRDVDQHPQAQPDGNREREVENAHQEAAARCIKWEKQTGWPRGTSKYAREIMQVPTNNALPWKRSYVCKKQGYAQIDH